MDTSVLFVKLFFAVMGLFFLVVWWLLFLIPLLKKGELTVAPHTGDDLGGDGGRPQTFYRKTDPWRFWFFWIFFALIGTLVPACIAVMLLLMHWEL